MNGAQGAGRDRPVRVLHLDHTSAPGGAEFALLRMLQAGPVWAPVVSVPPSGRGGVFSELPPHVSVRVTGVAQRAGISAGGARATWGAGARLLAQAIATRTNRAFRSADVIDANTARAAAYGALAARTSRTPFVIHLRDLVEAQSLGGLGFAMMSRIALPRADGVVANSRATLDSALPHLRPEAVTAVIPSASGIRRMPPSVRTGPVRVGMLARIDPWKGQRLVLEAFAAVVRDGDVRLELAGGAPFGHEQHLEELRVLAVELGIADRVAFLGHVHDVPELLSGWAIAVQASVRPEPLGQNVLQYLAAGCATVIADEGGPVEWVQDGVNGLRFQARDVGSLGAVLRRLIDDPQLRSRLSTAATATPGLLTDDEVAAEHAKFYNEVITAVSRS